MFDLDKFIADLRATLGERSQQPMKDVVARVMSDPASLLRRIGEPSEFGSSKCYTMRPISPSST